MGGSIRRLGVAVVLAGLSAACGGTTTGQGSYVGVGPAAAPTTQPPESTSAQPPPPPATAAETTTTTAPPPATSAPPTATPSDELAAQGWVVDSVEFRESVINTFEGTARVTNTAAAARSALFTFTLFVDEDVVASMIGSVSEVPAGGAVTVDLVGFDPYVEGPWSIDFQVDFTF